MSKPDSLFQQPTGCLFTKGERVFIAEKQNQSGRYNSLYSDQYTHYIPILNYSKEWWKKTEAYAAMKSKHITGRPTCCVSVTLTIRKLPIHPQTISVAHFTLTGESPENSRQSIAWLANGYLLMCMVPDK